MTRFLAVHGTKRRWAAATIEQGLVRDSAAWFVVPPRSDGAGLERTLAAAIYLSLAPATRGKLATLTGPGSYTGFFAAAEELLPAVLLFADEPTGQEKWHRYAWPGPPEPGFTFPYTKVERAARRVRLRNQEAHDLGVDLAVLARAEKIAGQAATGAPAPLQLSRLPANAPESAAWPDAAAGPALLGDKLTRVCAGIAAHLAVSAAPHIRQIVGPESMCSPGR